jgi:hypothetical protein
MKQRVICISPSGERMKRARADSSLELFNASFLHKLKYLLIELNHRIRSEARKDTAVWMLLGESHAEA